MNKIDNWAISQEPDMYCEFAERCHESGYTTAHLTKGKLSIFDDDVEGNHTQVEIPVEILLQLMKSAGYTVSK